jgi:hypothetical protein
MRGTSGQNVRKIGANIGPRVSRVNKMGRREEFNRQYQDIVS